MDITERERKTPELLQSGQEGQMGLARFFPLPL
jgi:hypothetical protein